ncbi:MAG: hypothetical protein ACL93V_06925 [Candidatus Electrothrix sp. YB6]
MKSAAPFAGYEATVVCLRRFMHDAYNMTVLRKVLYEDSYQFGIHSLSDQEVISQVARKAVRGQIFIARGKAAQYGGGSSSPSVKEVVPVEGKKWSKKEYVKSFVKEHEVEHSVPPEENWVELEHCVEYPEDWSDIEPACDVPYTITFGDGSVDKGYLDENGYARHDGIPPGQVTVEYEKDVDKEIAELHAQLKAELNKILEIEREEARNLEQSLQEKGSFGKAWEYTKSFGGGAWKATKDLAEFAYEGYKRNPIVNPIGAPLLWIEDLKNGKKVYDQLAAIPDEDIEAIVILLQDAATYDILYDFAKDYIAAQHSLEWSETAGTAIPEIIIAVLTAGIGTAVSGASKARHVSKLRKLKGLWQRLVKALKRRRFRHKKSGPHKTRIKSKSTPTSGESPRRKLHTSPKGPSRTTPSKAKGGKPRGDRTPETGSQKRKHKRENESANTLADAGYDIDQGPHKKPNGKKPDYKIEDEYFDCLAPDTDNVDQVRKGISRKVNSEQADRIVLNLDDTSLEPSDISEMLRRKPKNGLKEVIGVKNGKITQIFP